MTSYIGNIDFASDDQRIARVWCVYSSIHVFLVYLFIYLFIYKLRQEA